MGGTAVKKHINHLIPITSAFEENVLGAEAVEMGNGRFHFSHIVHRQARSTIPPRAGWA